MVDSERHHSAPSVSQLSGGELTSLSDTNKDNLDKAKAYIEENLQDVIQRHVPGGSPGTLKLFETQAEALESAWIVVEAIPEIRQAKIELLGALDQVLPSDVIIATNSSSFKASEIAEKVKNRDRLVNTHYYMPPESLYVLMQKNLFDDAGRSRSCQWRRPATRSLPC